VYEHFESGVGRRGREARQQWEKKLEAYRTKYPELAAELDQIQKRELPRIGRKTFPSFLPMPREFLGATRPPSSEQHCSQYSMAGGRFRRPYSFDRTRLTFASAGDFQADSPSGRNLHFGIREHSMGRF